MVKGPERPGPKNDLVQITDRPLVREGTPLYNQETLWSNSNKQTNKLRGP
jgi:hypothetical protein